MSQDIELDLAEEDASQVCTDAVTVASLPRQTPLVARVLTDEGLRGIGEAWERLSRKSLTENPFYSPQYVLAGLDTIDQNRRLRAFTIWAGGKLVGLFPFTSRFGAALGALNLYQFSGVPLLDWNHAEEVVDLWLEAIAARRIPGLWRFRDVPLDNGFGPLALRLAQRRQMSADVMQTYLRPKLTRLEGGFNEHLQRVLTKSRRKELDRAARRLREQGDLNFERMTDPAGVARRLEEFLALEHAGWKGSAGKAFASKEKHAAFARMAFGGCHGHQGLASVDSLLLDGRPIAMSVNIASGSVWFTPKCAYDESLRRYSPGLVLELFNIEKFYAGTEPAMMDAATTETGHVVGGLWNETIPMGTLLIGRKGSMASVGRALKAYAGARDVAKAAYKKIQARSALSSASACLEPPLIMNPAQPDPAEKRSMNSLRASAGRRELSSSSRQRVLVLGDDMRIFLAAVRSLGRAGQEVHAAPFNWHAPALKSRYVHKTHYLPRYSDDPKGWLRSLLSVLAAERIDLVLPCSDAAILPLDHHREQLSPYRLAIPSPPAMATLFDKLETKRLARQLSIPVAEGDQLRTADTPSHLAGRFGLPLVIKPRRSYWMDRLDTWGKVHIVESARQLEQVLSQVDDRERYLVESFFDNGEGVGVSVLASHGRVLTAFQHRRMREGWGGSSSYRISEAVDPELLRACQRVCSQTNLSGVCMFEFRRRTTNKDWILVETNARLWGSLALPVALGVNFPVMLFQLLVDGIESSPATYRPGIRSRNLVLDVFNVLSAFRSGRRKGAAAHLQDLADLALHPFRLLVRRETSDSFVLDDPLPGVWEIGSVLRSIPQRRKRKAPGSPHRRRRDLVAKTSQPSVAPVSPQ